MKRYLRMAGVVAFSATLAGCNDFLTGPGLSENPNQPVSSSTEALFIAIQARQFVLQEGQLARNAAIWTQQLTGVFNQQLEWGTKYNTTENDIQGAWAGFYIGGGLLDMRKVQAAANAAGDRRLEGIVKIWEGFAMGTAASLWGDIPYREAVDPNIAIPALDPQQQVYADVQARLDEGIALLTGLTPAAPLLSDLVYGTTVPNSAAGAALQVQRWIRAANTLKARYHLHTARRLGAAAYNAAIAAATNGINEDPQNVQQAIHGQAPGDFRGFHGNTLDDANIWSQFIAARTDIAVNHRFITVLQARNDPRLAEYVAPLQGGGFSGADQWGFAVGSDMSGIGAPRLVRTFRQPFITWTENQLILAEAKFQTSGSAAALPHVNAVRAELGMGALGSVTLENIMVEKWIAQYQNIDVLSDYHRTCFPVLIPGGADRNVPAPTIPSRLPYGSNERLQNPNVPPPNQQPAKNWNYAGYTCPTTGGTI